MRQKIAAAQMSLADVLRDKLDFDGSVAATQAALAAIREGDEGDPEGEAQANVQLGNTAYLRGNLQEAINRYSKALDEFSIIMYYPGEAGCLHGLGNTYRRFNQLDHAEDYYRKAAQFWVFLGRDAEAAGIWYELAKVSMLSG